jgi:hypothetical protein
MVNGQLMQDASPDEVRSSVSDVCDERFFSSDEQNV